MAILELRNVNYTYPGASRPAIEDVSLRLETGQFLVLTGDNGSGKSTLARVAAGLDLPSSGEIRCEPLGSRAALLFQNPDEQLICSKVEKELAWGLENLSLSPDEIKTRVENGLGRFRLQSIADQPPEALSDGQKQLVALAALAVMRPAFLILDEVGAFLDPYWARQVLEYTQSIIQDTGILWIASRDEAIPLSGRVLKIDRGRLTE